MPDLFPYQLTGADFLAARPRAILGDMMGLGKSCQAITAADTLCANNILVICRAVGRANWANEFNKFSSHKRDIQILYTGKAYKPKDGVTICSYETLPAILETDARFDVVITDESHYIKNPEAKRTAQVLGKNGIIHRTRYFWELSGTITPNHAGELWTHLFTFGFTKMKYDHFVDHFCIVRNNGFNRRQIVGTNTERIDELRALLKPVFLRRTIEGAGMQDQIPQLFFQDLVVQPGKVRLEMTKCFIKYVYPSDNTAELEQTIKEQYGILKGIVDGGFTFETMKAMEVAAKSTATLRRLNGLQKIAPVLELIEDELQNGAYQKVVIFAHHRDTIEHLHMYTRKYKSVKIYGGSKPDKLEERVRMFQKHPGCKIFIGNIGAAGTSINLTASNQVIVMEPDWVPGNNLQAIKRCHRIGQTKPVFVRFVSLANSLDQHIANILRRKTEEIAGIMGDAKENVDHATSADINSLL
jgi:SWI/SNF-related matrix-associated actin-dependent regulator 1 of chromatin subfamily A